MPNFFSLSCNIRQSDLVFGSKGTCLTLFDYGDGITELSLSLGSFLSVKEMQRKICFLLFCTIFGSIETLLAVLLLYSGLEQPTTCRKKIYGGGRVVYQSIECLLYVSIVNIHWNYFNGKVHNQLLGSFINLT